ncbi:MAG: hypothetical protein E7225_06200 [Clostridiales bacterium]|nr:hypothetical protein [Clostridiales bacterium]
MEYKEIIKEKLSELNLDELESILNDNVNDKELIFGDISVENVIGSIMSGEALFDTREIFTRITELFTYELKSTLIIGVEIIIITMLIGLLRSLSSSFGEKAVSNIAMLVSTCFIVGLCMTNFRVVYDIARDSVGLMSNTMLIILPILIPVLISTGGITSGGLLSPVITGTIAAFNTVMSTIILPGVFISTVFYMVNSLNDDSYISRLASFIRSASLFLCGICVTIFGGVSIIQGFVAETTDGLLIETARYSVNNFVPIVGGFAADSIDMVIMCLRTIKNGIGIVGVLIIVTLLIVPIIKLIAIAVMYKITSIIAEPLGNREISECLGQMGNSVITMSVILFLTSMMFIIFLSVIIGIGV